MANRRHTWNARVTFPAGSVHGGKTRNFSSEGALTVVAESVARCLELIEADYPGTVIWAVTHVGRREYTIVDSRECCALCEKLKESA